MKKKYFSIFLILIVSYFVSSFFIKNIFLADSPKIRPNLDTYFLAKISNTKNNILAKLNFNFSFPNLNLFPKSNLAENQNREEKINFLKSTLKPIAKGVRAASSPGYSYTEFKIDEIEWAQITYTLKNGQTVTIQYPKGTNPPPQFIYENKFE